MKKTTKIISKIYQNLFNIFIPSEKVIDEAKRVIGKAKPKKILVITISH